MPKPGQGLFIVFEGVDGSGLSTQAALLADHLRSHGRPVHLTKEPTSGPIGTVIRTALQGTISLGDDPHTREVIMALLFAADRMHHLAVEIEPRLREGIIVLCDRYYLSSFAYQSAVVDLTWIRSLHTHCRRPDVTILLDVPPEVSLQRIMANRSHRELYESLTMLTAVHHRYHEIATILRGEGEDIRIVPGDGERDIPTVHALVLQELGFILGR